MKNIRYAFEAALLHLLFFIFGEMPTHISSAVGGWLGRLIGPRLAASRKALRNIEAALPNLSSEQHEHAIRGMWDNLGRIIAEYPHLEKIGKHHVQIEGYEHILNDDVKASGALLISAHMGNWEICSASMLKQYDTPIDLTYRAPNNPWSDKLLSKVRTLNGRIQTYSKSRQGGKGLIDALKNKRLIGILIDQKYNEGISAPFFGMPAMTNPVFVQLAQKYKAPIIPVRGQRLDGANFKLTFYEPLKTFDESGAPLPIEDVISQAHEYLEEWITQKPEQWLWLHRRWKRNKAPD